MWYASFWRFSGTDQAASSVLRMSFSMRGEPGRSDQAIVISEISREKGRMAQTSLIEDLLGIVLGNLEGLGLEEREI